MNILPILVIGNVLALTASPAVLAQDTQDFEIMQEARNLSKQNFAWAGSVQAEPRDRLEFRIVVTWRGSQATQNVLVREILGQGIAYANNLKIDGVGITGSIVQENINIGALAPSQSKIVTFEAQADSAESFVQARTFIVNTATVFNAEGSASAALTVQVSKTGVPTDVPTGSLSLGMVAAALLMGVAASAGAFLFARSYIRREVLESPYDTREERKLAGLVSRIRKQERK